MKTLTLSPFGRRVRERCPNTSGNIHYVAFFGLIGRPPQRFETLPANSSEASLLLNSATSAAMMYRLFAIKWVRSQPRFS